MGKLWGLSTMRLLTALTVLSSLGLGHLGYATPPLSVAPHLTVVPARILSFSNSSWYEGPQALSKSTPIIIFNNSASYVTIEAYAENLSAPTHIDLLDAQTGAILDTLHFTAGNSTDTVRSIPLTSRSIAARAADPIGDHGRITIARVLAPPTPGDNPSAIVPMLVPISRYEGSLDPAVSAIEKAARSVALMQIAEVGQIKACTGFLVDQGLIATAAHCVQAVRDGSDKTTSAPGACDRIGIVFDVRLASGNRGRGVHCLSIKYLGDSSQSVPVATIPPRRVEIGDVALLAVDPKAITLVDSSLRPPLKLGVVKQEGLGAVVSFPQGGLERVAYNCPIGPGPEALMHHRCSTAPGSSGSPIMRFGDRGWEVVGVHVCCSNGFPIDGNTEIELRDALGIVNFGLPTKIIKDAMYH